MFLELEPEPHDKLVFEVVNSYGLSGHPDQFDDLPGGFVEVQGTGSSSGRWRNGKHVAEVHALFPGCFGDLSDPWLFLLKFNVAPKVAEKAVPGVFFFPGK